MMTKKLILAFISLILITSCSNKNRTDIDTSDIKVNIEIKRLDQDLFNLDPADIENKIPDLVKKYGEFFELYNARIINLGSPYEKKYAQSLNGFITDFEMNQVFEKTNKVFPDLKSLTEKMNTAFKRYKYYFPEKKIPAIYTYIGGFNQSVVVADSILGIGLDKYLGSDCIFYDRLGIERYLQTNMNPENIPVDAMRAWALSEFVYNDSIDNLVNNMIYQGKIQYFLDEVLPELNDSLKFGFTGNQLSWCIKNKKHMWDYLIEQKLLFSTDYMTINKYINPAPFTSGYPRESPGRASVWMGWGIVKAYMDRNSKISLRDLMLDDDYQKILSESRYEP